MKVASLQNWSHDRGVDRVMEVAEYLPEATFLVAGKGAKTWQSQPPNVVLTGYVDAIDLLRGATVLVRLTRRNDPWGRDVIEALAMGVPVVATGSWSGYVKHGVNGFLVPDYNPQVVADYLQQAASLPYCNDNRFGSPNIKQLEAVYENIIRA